MTDDLEAALRRMAARDSRAGEKAAQRVILRLEQTPLPPQKRALAWWPSALMDDFTPAWPRVAALAVAAVLGISIGLSNLGTRIATDLDLVRVASADDINSVLDLDVGFRP